MRRLALLTAIAPVFAQAQVGGPGQFPQFRSMSGLPGSGYGVLADGRIDPLGAWSVSTPIAYQLRPWQFSVGFGSLSPNSRPRFIDTSSGESRGNGTAQITVGLPLGKYGSGTYTLEVLSGKLDNASNFTYSPPGQNGPVRFGVGVQDIGGGGGTQGEGANGKDPGSSTSFFVVGTYEGTEGLHASLGAGSRRFDGVFGNVSANLTPRTKAVLEYDTFNWNFGVGYDLGRLGQGVRAGYDSGASLFVGMIRGKFAYWSVNIRF